MKVIVFPFDNYVRPVSYTHLDVYKRQGWRWKYVCRESLNFIERSCGWHTGDCRQCEKIKEISIEQADSMEPVSYTHLDVYKRQGGNKSW